MEPGYVIPAAVGVAVIVTIAVVLLLWRTISAISVLRAAKSDLECRLAVEEQKAPLIPELKQSLTEKSVQAEEPFVGKASIERDLATTTEALSQTKVTLFQVRARISSLEAQEKESFRSYDAVKNEKSKLEESIATKSEALKRTESVIQDFQQRLETADKLRDDLATKLQAAGIDAILGVQESGKTPRTLLDPKDYESGGKHAVVDYFQPSRDGAYVAVDFSLGAQRITLSILSMSRLVGYFQMPFPELPCRVDIQRRQVSGSHVFNPFDSLRELLHPK